MSTIQNRARRSANLVPDGKAPGLYVGVLGEVGQLCRVGRGFHNEDVAALRAPRVVGELPMQVIDAGPVLANGVVREVLCGGCASQDAAIGAMCGCGE